jgi:hypothetical protein
MARKAESMLIEQPVALEELQRLARAQFGDFIKAVVDVEQGIMALGSELHADDEAFLLDRGSEQSQLWGINIHPFKSGDQQVVFDSLINIRPAAGNLSQNVEAEETRRRIRQIVSRLIRVP